MDVCTVHGEDQVIFYVGSFLVFCHDVVFKSHVDVPAPSNLRRVGCEGYVDYSLFMRLIIWRSFCVKTAWSIRVIE